MQISNLKKFLAIAIVAASGCSSNGQQPTESNTKDSLAADTTTQNIIKPNTQKKIVAFPDTAYQSINVFKWEVTIFDTTISGELSTLESFYENTPGIFTFRGNNLRNADFGGKLTGSPTKVEKVWRFDTYYDNTPTKYGTWGGGSGWTGQPLFVDWPDSIFQKFKNQSPALKDFANKEIIVGSLCGRVYFINYESGKASREHLDAGNTIKGTTSLDPDLNGNLYCGQGVPCRSPFGNVVFDLFKHQRTFIQDKDPNAWRGWGAFDSSPIKIGDFLIWPSENGTLYKYIRKQGTLVKHSTLRYKKPGANSPGIESSICVYKNYGWFGDNHGNILCVNLNTMHPVWTYNNHDDSDGTIVCKIENDTPYIYAGCEVDKQGTQGQSHIIKLNGITGEKIWDLAIDCKRNVMPGKTLDGGMYCTPLLGKGDCENLLFANICINGSPAPGMLYAINTQTGQVEYKVKLKQFAWSSPIAFYNEQNQMYIFTGDASGNVYLIKGKTGEIIFCQNMATNFESSPIAIDNFAIVGSRGNGIYKFEIK